MLTCYYRDVARVLHAFFFMTRGVTLQLTNIPNYRVILRQEYDRLSIIPGLMRHSADESRSAIETWLLVQNIHIVHNHVEFYKQLLVKMI